MSRIVALASLVSVLWITSATSITSIWRRIVHFTQRWCPNPRCRWSFSSSYTSITLVCPFLKFFSAISVGAMCKIERQQNTLDVRNHVLETERILQEVRRKVSRVSWIGHAFVRVECRARLSPYTPARVRCPSLRRSSRGSRGWGGGYGGIVHGIDLPLSSLPCIDINARWHRRGAWVPHRRNGRPRSCPSGWRSRHIPHILLRSDVGHHGSGRRQRSTLQCQWRASVSLQYLERSA